MKTGWSTRKIGDLCDVIAGQSPEGKFYNFDGNGIPFYQGKKEFGERYLGTPTTWTTQITKEARKDDILMSVRAPVGPVNIATERICIGRGLAAIRCKKELDRDFLYYQLLYLQPEIAGHDGAVFPSINKSDIEALPISFTPLPEQQRIVRILDEAFAGIAVARANAEKNLQNAREVFESYVDEIFSQHGAGWKEAKFGDVCSFVRGPFGGSLKKSIFRSHGYAIYEQQHAIYNQFTDIRYYIGDDKFSEMKRFELKEGDLIMSCSGTMGRVAIVPLGIKRGIINQALLKLTPKPIVLNTYLKYWMESDKFQEALSTYSSGAAIQNVASVSILKEIRVPLPSISEQQFIVNKFYSMLIETRHLESIFQQELSSLGTLKQSMLYQAFNGEL